MSEARFEEKILYKTHQHWIILVLGSLKLIGIFAIPAGFFGWFFSGLSLTWGWSVFFLVSIIVVAYDHYLWHHSWLMIGNQKITLSVRNGIFSQYAMNIRYRNIRDSAVSKNSMVGYLLKFGTLFIRSSANEGDFQAHYVPKVGKLYAIVNALSRYSDDERATIHSVEELHAYHKETEFSHEKKPLSTVEDNLAILDSLPGITASIPLEKEAREYISLHEEVRNRGVVEVLERQYVVAVSHNHDFRAPPTPLTKTTANGELYFPSVPFPEVSGNRVVSASPSHQVHTYLNKFLPYIDADDATILIGWDA